MGHFLFIVLHVIAVLFGWVLLIFTIPLHLIYSVLSARPSAQTEGDSGEKVRCPDCRELVRADASKCKHCGSTLTPQPEKKEVDNTNFAIGLGAVVAILVLAKACDG